MTVRPLRREDHAAWLAMRSQLWPDGGTDEVDVGRWLARTDAVTLVAEEANGSLMGFAEAGERAYADGCDTSPVAFLEGWFVMPEQRGKGCGTALLQAVTAWARSRHLTELASDSLLDDDAAIAAHLRSGFVEVERSVKFHMELTTEGR